MNLNKGISTPIAIIIIVICAALAGGIAVWQYKEIKEAEAPEKETPPLGEQEEEEGEDKTADWNTYTNEEYGFEIKYPSEWIIIKESAESTIFADKQEAEAQKERQAGEIRCSAGIWFYNNIEDLPLRDWAIDKWGEPEKRERGKISKVKINGLEGVKYEFMSMGTETNVLFSKNKKVIDIQTTFNGCEDLPVIFNQMLSTFRFLD